MKVWEEHVGANHSYSKNSKKTKKLLQVPNRLIFYVNAEMWKLYQENYLQKITP